ncbi:hypothetical protein yberc0001_19280 [Yersinia bercovieri ATCC 43970]|uniref:Uncharacterized protein n=1 Tax=Yersinia bercovieri ATCC 43970 TaxID=349968 RepID=A0ABM9Y1N3_YERBE|nr:hypothetical protein yberc0001_19280 [Yersinia bercovieri ATCC 43970]
MGAVKKYMNQQELAQVVVQLKKLRAREIVWLRLFWHFFLADLARTNFI